MGHPQEDALDRKNYFHPDNPKSLPISVWWANWLQWLIEGMKMVRLRKIGINAPTWKKMLVKHPRYRWLLCRPNRQGVPLIEVKFMSTCVLLKKPYAYSTALKWGYPVAGIPDVKMEEGSMRGCQHFASSLWSRNWYLWLDENLNSFSKLAKVSNTKSNVVEILFRWLQPAKKCRYDEANS